MEKPFWETKPLNRLSRAEWEALCDGCARCCLEKLRDDRTGKVFYTKVACKILDIEKCRCRHYSKRHLYIVDCLPIKLKNKKLFSWLPSTCAYRLLYEGKKLPNWHYLLSDNKEVIHTLGISVRNLAIPQEEHMNLDDYIIDTF